MRDRKRPMYIEKLRKDINATFRKNRLKDNEKYDNELWTWFMHYLLDNGWYRGYNMYVDNVFSNGETRPMLAGLDWVNEDYYVQLL